MLLAVPKYGQVKVNKILAAVPDLAEQDDRRPVPAPARGAGQPFPEVAQRARTADSAAGRSRKLFVITGPSGVGKGTLIRRLLERGPRPGAVGLGDHAAARPGEQDGVDYHFLERGGVRRPCRAGRVPRARALRRPTATGRCARRSSRGWLRVAASCSRSRSRARARCARRCPRRCQVFIAPPSRGATAPAPRGPRHRRPEQIERRLSRRRSASWRRGSEFAHVVVNDDVEPASATLRRLVRRCRLAGGLQRRADDAARIGLRPTGQPRQENFDPSPHRQPAGARRHPLRGGDRRGEAGAPDQQLLPHARRGSFRGVPARRWWRRPPRTTSRSPSKKSRRARSIALPYERLTRRRACDVAGSDGTDPAWSDRRHLRLQGGRAGAPGDQGRPLGARDPDPGEPASSSARATFEGITGAPVLVDEFERDPAGGAYPGRAASGPRPDQPSRAGPTAATPTASRPRAPTRSPSSPAGTPTTCVTARLPRLPGPVVIAPAMNNRMYEHPATQANLGACASAAYTWSSPARGAGVARASGAWAAWPSRPSCSSAIELAAGTGSPRPLDGLRVLVTAGGTREPLDSVRYIGNRSSGRMGFALAAEAARRGARVTVIAANVTLPRAPGIDYVDVETAEQLRRATLGALRRLRRAPDGRRGRRLPPGRAARRQDRQGGARATRARAGADRRTCCPSWPARAGRTRPSIGFAAEHGAGGRRARAGQARAQGASTRSS